MLDFTSFSLLIKLLGDLEHAIRVVLIAVCALGMCCVFCVSFDKEVEGNL